MSKNETEKSGNNENINPKKFTIEELVEHFRNSDTGNKDLNNAGKGDQKLNTDEMFEALASLVEKATGKSIDRESESTANLKLGFTLGMGALNSVKLEDMGAYIKNLDKDNDGSVTLEEAGLSQRDLEALVVSSPAEKQR